MSPPPKAGVFISYARSDGEELARDLRQRLTAEAIPLWRDREGMEGGRDWWMQIIAALDRVEFMVLVMTPAAMESALVRKEWRYARQRGVCVYPVQGVADLEFEKLPRWMRSVHFYDLEQEWAKFLNDLRTRCQRRRVPFMVEDLPAEFVPRPAEFEQLLTHLLDRVRDEPIAITTALRAAGGYGKTVLARALCHDEHVQNAFDDGILWVTLGENPGDLTGRVEDLIYLLSGERPGFAGIEAATTLLVELLADRDILLVVDDVWDAAHLKPFLQGGPRCARVITTRILDTLPAGSSRVDVDAMRQNEAVSLIGFGLPPGFEADLRALAARLGEWPLLLKLANAALRDRVQTGGQSVPAALAYVNKALDKRGLTFFDARDPVARHQAVAKTMELSIERLSPNEQTRFAELAVFPEDFNIPLATLTRLWGRTGGFDEFDTEHLSDRLNRLSLTLAFDPTQRYVRLHDIVRRYLVQRLGDRITALHSELLDSHRPSSGAWADLPQAEPYMWDHLADHLVAAGRHAELVASVQDLRYLAAKTLARNALAVERDLLVAERSAQGDEAVALLRRSFVQSGHILNKCGTIADTEAALHSRLQHLEPLTEITSRLTKSTKRPYLTALHPLPDLPHPALIRTLSGSASTLWGCAISPDGSFIVSTPFDGAPTVWDTRTATERFKLSGHKTWVRRCAISADGSLIVTASYDRRLHIWDAATGALRQALVGHTDGVTDCAISPDGSFIVSASLDETVRIWDTHTGKLRRTLAMEWDTKESGWLVPRSPSGHSGSVWGCAISPNGRFIASAAADQTVKIWDAGTGRELRTLTGHSAMVNSCTFSRDGRLVASASADGTIRVWDRESGAERVELYGHTGPVNRCVFGPDGTWIVSASTDRTLKIWDIATGERVTLFGHTDIVNDCAVASDGSFVLSASLDGTLKIWDATQSAKGSRLAPHRDWVNCCALSADGSFAVSASSDLRLKSWSTESGFSQRTFSGHENSVLGCAVGPAGQYIVSASADKSIRVWEPSSGELIANVLGHGDWVNCCSIHPGGQLLLSASSDKTVRLWDTRTWAKRMRIVAHADSINSCAFSPNGAFFVSASSDGTLKIWDVQAVQDFWESAPGDQKLTELEWDLILKPVVLEGHTKGIHDCAIASDSSFVVSASSDRTLKIWDVATGAARRTLVGHRRDVYGCAITADDNLIASVSEDKTLKVWQAASGECLATLHVDGGLADCEWLPDGKRIVAVGAGGVYFLVLVVGAG